MDGGRFVKQNRMTKDTEKKKILLIANDTTYVYNLRNEVIERLLQDGYEVVIASELLNFQDRLKEMGCRLIGVKTDRHGTDPAADIRLFMQYRGIIKAEKPDAVLTYNIKPNVYGGMACRLGKVHYLPNITGLGTAVEYPGILQKISVQLYKAGVRGADCIFFQNEENRKFFEDHHITKKGMHTRVLPGSGVSLKIHKRMDYPADESTIHFLFIARIMKEKGIDLYLNAAERIHKVHENTVFHICGKCDDEKYVSLLSEKKKGGYIIWHGEQKNMIPFYEQAHCIVHPSYYPEGMSNVLLEAAAHCRPIIATDRAGCRETVENGRTGWIVPPQDEDALVAAIEKFIDISLDEKRDMGLAGREKIEREFDRRLVVDAYMEEIEKLKL